MILTPVKVPGAIGVDHQQTDPFTATDGQTVFTLSQTPVDPNDVRMRINGVGYDVGVDYVVVGTSVTWMDVLFVLEAGEAIEFMYNF